MRGAVFAVPGDLSTPTGGYAYDRRMIAELSALGWSLRVLDLGGGFPFATHETIEAACDRLAALPPRELVVIDGLAFGVLPGAARQLQQSHRVIALVHHPLALETGLTPEQAAAFRASEREALAHARHAIVSSASTARLLTAEFDMPAQRVSVVEPGTDRAIAPRTDSNSEVVRLLAVGSIVPRKGYDLLVDALSQLCDLPWRLRIAGDSTRSAATAAALKSQIARLGLAERITLTGPLSRDELAALYAASDLFVLPSRFEGYGMAFAEAIAHGLPVIGAKAGAVPETVPATAGVLVEVDDVVGLRNALRDLIADRSKRERLAEAARRTRFPTWGEQARRFAWVLEQVA